MYGLLFGPFNYAKLTQLNAILMVVLLELKLNFIKLVNLYYNHSYIIIGLINEKLFFK